MVMGKRLSGAWGIFSAVFAVAVLCLFVCSCGEEREYPYCGAARITYGTKNGELLSSPPDVELDEIPELSSSELPSDSSDRVVVRDGLWRLTQDLKDLGEAESSDKIRLLISLPMRNVERLDSWLEKVYDPEAEEYLNFISASCITSMHAPRPESIARLAAYFRKYGMKINRISANRLMLLLEGTVEQAEAAFDFEAHRVIRVQRADFAARSDLSVPEWLAADIDAVLGIQDLPDNPQLPEDTYEPVIVPYAGRVSPIQIRKVYGVLDYAEKGMVGQGQSIGIILGSICRESDLQSYFSSLGIERSGSFEWKFTDYPPTSFSLEAAIDIQLSGAIAPGADLIAYVAAGNRDFDLVWATNEAIGEGRVSVITYSFAHQEVIAAWELQEAYSRMAKLGAAQGISFFSASGDSRSVDTPSNSPWVTAVGSTYLTLDDDWERIKEIDAWFGGRGRSELFLKPDWQRSVDPESLRRSTVDLSLHCMANIQSDSFFVFSRGKWSVSGGTSLAAPLLAGMTAVVNQARGEKGRLGWINRTLYTNAELQKTFFDVTESWLPPEEAEKGWDAGTGWGSPDMRAWVDVIP